MPGSIRYRVLHPVLTVAHRRQPVELTPNGVRCVAIPKIDVFHEQVANAALVELGQPCQHVKPRGVTGGTRPVLPVGEVLERLGVRWPPRVPAIPASRWLQSCASGRATRAFTRYLRRIASAISAQVRCRSRSSIVSCRCSCLMLRTVAVTSARSYCSSPSDGDILRPQIVAALGGISATRARRYALVVAAAQGGRSLAMINGRLPRGSRWLRQSGAPHVRNRNGVPWHLAPIPRCWHACRPQTIELYRDGPVLNATLHCACGAVTDSTGRWRDRNSRRVTDPTGCAAIPEPSPSTGGW